LSSGTTVSTLSPTHFAILVILLSGVSIWLFGFVLLTLVWFMSRPNERMCPVCGDRVRRGWTVCQTCHLDFAVTANRQQVERRQ
jgi:hypothetical protein